MLETVAAAAPHLIGHYKAWKSASPYLHLGYNALKAYGANMARVKLEGVFNKEKRHSNRHIRAHAVKRFVGKSLIGARKRIVHRKYQKYISGLSDIHTRGVPAGYRFQGQRDTAFKRRFNGHYR